MSQAPIIRMEEIRKTYIQGEDRIEVLKGVSLTVLRGEFVAFQGASGSGKSTLLHIVGLLDTPTSGLYELDGQDVSALTDNRASALRNIRLGFVFQSFYLIPYATALENVMLPGMYGGRPGREIRSRAEALLDRVGLADRKDFRPSQLSGGQQQRVAMARALLHDPDLILADEPTGQLDATTSREIIDLFQSIHGQGATIILVTHDRDVAASAKRVIRLTDGRVEDDR